MTWKPLPDFYRIGYAAFSSGSSYLPPPVFNNTNICCLNHWAYDLGWETAKKKLDIDLTKPISI